LRALARNLVSPGNAAATNQAPCQFAPSAVSAWKQEAFAERPRPACDLLSSAAQTPLKSAQFLIRRCEGGECHAPRIDARECLGGIGGARLERGHAQGANVLGRTADAGVRWLAAVTARALRLLPRLSLPGQS